MTSGCTYRYALLVLTVTLWLVTSTAHAQDPEQLFRQGLGKFARDDYQGGLELFSSARTNLPSPPPYDPALNHYNEGIAHYRLSQPEQATAAFREALKTTDIRLQRMAYFNTGNACYQSGQQALNDGEVARAFLSFQEASTNYMQTLRLDPDDTTAKVNFELSVQAQLRILQMVAMAMERMQQGEALVGNYRFVEAAQWFQQNLPAVEQALSLEPEAQKHFKAMTDNSAAVAGLLQPPRAEEGP